MPLLAQRAVASPAVKGTLYIVGGGPQPPALVREFLDLAAQSGRSRIVVFGMASEEGKTGGDQSKLTAALGGSRTATAISSAIVSAQSLEVGFGLIDNAIVDQHFLRRRRHNRLIRLVLEREPHLGVGIDESTALSVSPDASWRVAGASGAVISDARKSAITAADTPLGATGMTMHVLPAGSRFDPKTGVATLPSTR